MSTDLPETWHVHVCVAVMVAVGSINIYCICLIFIYTHKFNTGNRCVEFDTVNAFVTINLYVKSTYDKIFALYI